MIFTARQLEEMFRATGRVVLPYRARLTPLAQDWVRHKRVTIGYADLGESGVAGAGAAMLASQPAQPAKWLWWADSPCGPAKAALLGVAREAPFEPIEIGVDPSRIVETVKIVAKQVKDGKVAGAILLVQSGAAAMVYANRCPSLRAILGTCMDAVAQGTKLVAANAIVIEHPYKSLQQVKALLAQFVRTQQELSEQVRRELSELSSCE